MKRFKSIALLLVLIFPFCSSCDNQVEYGSYEDNSQVGIITSDIIASFELAEKNIYDMVPVPDDKPLGPDPDVNKCACKGTGRIVHGDGHVTKCPFHLTELLIRNYEDQEKGDKNER
jgi:hypothetical protein